MKKFTKLSIVLTLLAILLIPMYEFFKISINENEGPFDLNERVHDEDLFKKPKSSSYWALDPFVIDQMGTGNYTWAEAVLESWCSGNGTWADPYLIENLTINGQNLNTCIVIKNSNSYFTINNISVYNSSLLGEGILLKNVTNAMIKNSNASDNNGNGIFIDQSNNITISGNIVSNNRNGIFLWDNNAVNISQNNVSNNEEGGINIGDSSKNSFSGNIVQNNKYGISLYGFSGSHENTVSENIVNNNDEYGIFLSRSNKNTVSGNFANHNYKDGIYVWESKENLVSLNTANYNDEDGIILWLSNDNTVIGNTANFNKKYGIELYRSNYNVVSENTLIGNLQDCVYADEESEGNTIDNLCIEEPDFSWAIFFVIITIFGLILGIAIYVYIIKKHD